MQSDIVGIHLSFIQTNSTNMLKLIVRKWWVILLQGILLLLTSLFIFRNPATVLSGVSIWMGLLIFISGVIALLTTFANDKSENKLMLITWSALTIVFGFLM